MAGVGGERQPRRHGQRGDQVPGGQPGQPLAAHAGIQRGQQYGHGRQRLGHRSGQRVVTEFLAGHHEVQRARAESAPLLRHRERGDAEPGQPPPQGQAGRQVAVGPPPRGGRHVGPAQQVVQRPGELLPLGPAHRGRAHRGTQAEDPLGDQRALDLVGARVDRARQREQVVLQPAPVRSVADLGVRTQQVKRRLVQRDVELGPEHLAQAGFGSQRAAGGQPFGGRLRVQLVGAGADPGVGHPVPQGGIVRVAGPPPQLGQPGGRREEPPGAAQRQPALVARGGHRDPPAVARRAHDVGVRDEHVVQEDLREPGPPAELADRPHGHPRRAQPEEQVGQPAVPICGQAAGAFRRRERCGTGRTPGPRTPPASTTSWCPTAASPPRSAPPGTGSRPGRCPPRVRTRPAPTPPPRWPSGAGTGPAGPRCRARTASGRAATARSVPPGPARRPRSTPPRRPATRPASRPGRRSAAGQETTESRAAASSRSHSRCRANPSAVSSDGSGSAGACAASQSRTSARQASARKSRPGTRRSPGGLLHAAPVEPGQRVA